MRRTVTAAIVLSLLGGSSALAQSRHNDRHDDHRRPAAHGPAHHGPSHHIGQRDNRGRYYAGEYHRPRGWTNHAWRRGERLPPAYRGSSYYVNNYGVYGLRAPPRGYRYVRVNNDVVMVSIASGLISQIISNRLYY